jgi:hypothetical protein
MTVHVVFVAPYFGASMVHCLGVLAQLEGVRLGIVTHEPEERIPAALRDRIAGHFRVPNTLDPDQLVLAARAFQKEWGRVDRLLGYLEQLTLPLAQAREVLGIPGMRPLAATNFRDKNRMKETLAKAGLPVARQARVTRVEDALRFVGAVGYPIVLKPLAGVGTKDTMRASTDEELLAALNVLLPTSQNPVQAEQFVSGQEHTFETVSIGGTPVWSSSTYYLPGPLQVVENPWMQYCVLYPREQLYPAAESFRSINAQALEALGMDTGLTHMEWFRQADASPVISEVAARPPGVNIMAMNGIAHGVDFWAKWARLMVHGTWEMPEQRWACGCAFFRGQGRGRVVRAVDGLDEVLAELGDTVVQGQTPKVGQPRSSHYEGEGWAIVRHETTQGVVQALRALITRTQIQYD